MYTAQLYIKNRQQNMKGILLVSGGFQRIVLCVSEADQATINHIYTV